MDKKSKTYSPKTVFFLLTDPMGPKSVIQKSPLKKQTQVPWDWVGTHPSSIKHHSTNTDNHQIDYIYYISTWYPKANHSLNWLNFTWIPNHSMKNGCFTDHTKRFDQHICNSFVSIPSKWSVHDTWHPGQSQFLEVKFKQSRQNHLRTALS